MSNTNYQWKRQKRGKSYIPPLLSAEDDFVPETHIGMYRLLRNPNDPAIYMSEAQCQKLRHETFDGVLALFKKYGSPDFQVFWNYNLPEINALGLNKFGTHTKILPVIGLIECFEKKMTLKSNGRMRYVISFGINKKRLVDYFKSASRAKKTGETVPPPKFEPKTKKSKDLILFGEARLKADGGILTIDKNSVYNQFCHWCDLNGVTKKNATTMALKFFVENHPIDGVGELSEYQVLTEFDAPVLARSKDIDVDDEVVKVRVDANVLAKAKQIIKLYNYDVANIAKEKLTLDGYFNNATHLLNQNMPLKYRDPELYDQQVQLELMEAQVGHKPEDDEIDFGFDEIEDGSDE